MDDWPARTLLFLILTSLSGMIITVWRKRVLRDIHEIKVYIEKLTKQTSDERKEGD
jgi:hypothetical protein